MNVLITYRLQAFKTEVYVQLDKYRNDNITFVVQNDYGFKWLPVFLERFSLKDINVKIITVEQFLKGELDSMTFDYIVGNPPYQNGKESHGQNKIYNAISKKCINLLSPNGIINFITPISVTRTSKRFSILNQSGLKSVNFDVNKEFDVGVTVCSWSIDKTYDGTVDVISNDVYYTQNNDLIYNPDASTKEFINIYNTIRKISKNLNNRMFQRNNFGTKLYNGTYDIYSRVDGPVTYNSQNIPYFYKKQKCLFRLSGSYKDGFFLSEKDMDVNHICIESTETEFNNVQSFVYSDYFKDLVQQWKKYTDSKSYDILTYLPKFDKTKTWSNNEVKEFFKELVDD